MELRNINTFLHIAELHSFSRTARHLGYSPVSYTHLTLPTIVHV